jgi:quinolinate synthase
VPRAIMLPDEYLARNTAAQTSVEIIAWKGHCEVHERFTAADIRSLRESHAYEEDYLAEDPTGA